jgi:hypothetical protein
VGWRLEDARLLDRRACTTTPSPLRIFSVPPERGRWCLGSARQMVWRANRLPMLQPAVQLPSMTFTGSNAASIDALDATKNARKGAPVSSLDLDP